MDDSSSLNRKLYFLNLDKEIGAGGSETNSDDDDNNKLINYFNIKKTNDLYLKSNKKNNKQCILKDLHFNGDYLIKKKQTKKIQKKNGHFVLPNKYDYILKKKSDIFHTDEFISKSYHLNNVHDIYYSYKEESDLCDILIKRYKENLYVTTFNNMLILINPTDNVMAFYKLLFKPNNKNNYIINTFVRFFLEKKLQETTVEYQEVNDSEDLTNSSLDYEKEENKSDYSSNEIKNAINYINKKHNITINNQFNFNQIKKKRKKKKLVDIKKDLCIKSNQEFVQMNTNVLKKNVINFNMLYNINAFFNEKEENYEENKSNHKENIYSSHVEMNNYNTHVNVYPNSFEKATSETSYKLKTYNEQNKLLFIYGENYSNQNVINKYIFKHIIKKYQEQEDIHTSIKHKKKKKKFI
ncbi:hypothetical protein PFFCH_02498 [Plasmodium falciparum FCH/4]|uniref:Uncharacterized protein n=1 Tax=Plasmodium falciparum FCH/4 TaxID=1036724 RepID=A0A024VNK0_PLAFA|nr:hypothetical protein PFFCH_02498 [Plasmodium falciparum FCH/4]